MKTYIYIITILMLIGLGYNLYAIDYKVGLFSDINFKSMLGVCASVCGLLTALVFFSFFKLQTNLKKQ